MGVIQDALGSLANRSRAEERSKVRTHRGLGAWFVDRLRRGATTSNRLRVVEQIRVTPRQLLVLVEVEGERLLMATSDVSAPAFYPVKKCARPSRQREAAIRIEGTCA